MSTTWYTNTDLTFGPYFRVRSDGVKQPIGSHLISPEAGACTKCHRIAVTVNVRAKTLPGETCATWLDDEVKTNRPIPRTA